MDFPQENLSPLFVHTGMSGLSGVGDATFTTATRTSAVISPVSGTAVYMPVMLPWPYFARRVFWVNGSTVTSGENDFGIYTPAGARLYHTGKKAVSGASTTQYVAPEPALHLPAGEYLFALFYTGTVSNRWNGYNGAESARTAGCLSQAGLTELPESATFAAAAAPMPICGITRTASGL